MKRKNVLALTLVLLLIFTTVFASACGKKETAKDNDIIIGVSPSPHADIVKQVVDDLEKEGIKVTIKEYSEYVQPNLDLAEGEIDANFFQHTPYLEEFIAERDLDLSVLGGIHIEPMGIFSTTLTSLDELKDGDEVMIPNDTTNCGRALLLLQEQGLIKLGVEGVNATEKDITENPKNLKFTALEAAAIPTVYGDAAIAVINGNYAIQHELNPVEDSLAIEDANSPYVNIIAVRSDEAGAEKFQKLLSALQTDKVKDFIEETYSGSVVPAFSDADGNKVG
ncbi:MAG TPA: MetQ/NlpA family ABC transporter substrate-binding protein [Bacillota bacterium]|jgi:D-methionine transport system substrate-binding protein|nr:MetQ/NlpA family ABC transporter substrate-binding protein [Bacillota bacterium]